MSHFICQLRLSVNCRPLLPNPGHHAKLTSMMRRRRKHYTPQFDTRHALRNRPFERFIFSHDIIGPWIKSLGRIALTTMLWPRLVSPYRWSLEKRAMPFARLPRELDGYKILHLTDLHAGATRQSYLMRVLNTAMRTKPDLVLITGDLMDYLPAGLTALAQLLPLLAAPDGVQACFGNHDYHEYSWRHVGKRSSHRAIHKRLRTLLHDKGVNLLCNRNVEIRRGNNRIWIVGMDELWTGNADPAAAFSGVMAGEPCICLQHNPDGLAILRDYPWHWMLSGHTHGGQIVLPGIGPLFVPVEHREWIRGTYQFPHPVVGRQTLYVSRGIGSTIPIRLRCPPEVCLFTVCREK